ncbi:MAG: hypothetical protein R3F59_35465 [Myxococcota bacterium]
MLPGELAAGGALGTDAQRIVVGRLGDFQLGVDVQGAGDLDGDGRDDAILMADSCGYDFHAAPEVVCRDGERGRTSWSVVLRRPAAGRAGVGVRAPRWWRCPRSTTTSRADAARVAGRFGGDVDQLSTSRSGCAPRWGTRARSTCCSDVALGGRSVALPEGSDAVLRGAQGGSRRGRRCRGSARVSGTGWWSGRGGRTRIRAGRWRGVRAGAVVSSGRAAPEADPAVR